MNDQLIFNQPATHVSREVVVGGAVRIDDVWSVSYVGRVPIYLLYVTGFQNTREHGTTQASK